MKKFLLLCFILSSFFSFAQNWQPFPLGQKSYFMHNNVTNYYSPDTLLNEFCVDSIRDYGSSQTHYFHFKTPGIGNCYSTIISNNFPSNFYYSIHDNERPDSITVSNNEYTFYFYDAFFQPQDIFILKSYAQKDSSWVFPFSGSGFNQLKITCDSIYYDNIIGSISDSLKLFSVQAMNNGTPVSDIINQNKYILSKNYGFKIFNNYPLLGLNSNLIQEGFSPPTFHDYFHLNIGDVLIWKEEFRAPPWPGNPSSYTNYYKDSITNVFNLPDTVSYIINRLTTNLTSSSYSSTAYKTKSMSYLGYNTSTISPDYINNTSSTIYLDEVSPYTIKNGIVYKTRMNEFKYLSTTFNNCEPSAIPDYGWNENYNTKYGFYSSYMLSFDQTTSWDIIGSTINGIQEGVAWSTLVTGINDIENISDIKIYPNPSKSGNFTVESEKPLNLIIVSIEGKVLFNQKINQYKTNLKTNLPKGMYLVKLIFENNKQAIQKLIISE
ncbi:MAG: T9SS type A sorting domain-containing protein [Flavobacteriales bacterium]|nr:T9SS type A sorting domain-containing protein [Flavobacteriales bacterium]